MLYLWLWCIIETIRKLGATWTSLFLRALLPSALPTTAPRVLFGYDLLQGPCRRALNSELWLGTSDKKFSLKRSFISIALSCPGSVPTSFFASFTPSGADAGTLSPCCSPGCRHQKWKCNSGLNLTEISDSIENVFSSIITNTLLHKWHHLCVIVVLSPPVLHLVTAEEGRMSWDTTSPHNRLGFLGSHMCCCLLILPWDGFADKKKGFLASHNLSRPDISAARQLRHINLRGECPELLYF